MTCITIGSRGGGGGNRCSWPSQMHEVTYDFLVVHIKASQKSLGDKPKSVYIFLQNPHDVYTRKSYFLDNSANKHQHLINYVSIPMLSGPKRMIRLLMLWFESLFCHKYAN